MIARVALVVGMAGCGRFGFAPPDDAPAASDGTPGDGLGEDATQTDDARPDGSSMITCADVDLGSAVGPAVAMGNTSGQGNQYTGCTSLGSDVSFGWVAPAAGMYRIDLCASQQFWDSVLYIRDGTCNGPEIACSDDVCGGVTGLHGRVTLNLAAGQGIVIIVDSTAPGFDGDYQLAITPL